MIVVIFGVLGGMLVASGIAVVLFRSRFATNLARAGLVGPALSPVSYAVSLGVGQIAFGALLVLAAVAGSEVLDDTPIRRLFAALADEAGAGAPLIIAALVVTGILAAVFGGMLFTMAWRRRENWGSATGMRIPRRDLLTVGAATTLIVFGVLAVVVGALLTAAINAG